LGFAIVFPTVSWAVRVQGRITGKNGEGLSFANVFVKGTTVGTTANIEGDYWLELNPGSYTLVFSLIGYKQVALPVIVLQVPVVLDVSLDQTAYELTEVTIRSEEEDPAYAIIRKAQKKRAYYLEQVKSFTCESYVKSTQRLTAYPKVFMGQDVNMSDVIDTTTGIFYLSESVSTIAILLPGKLKEEMISSKVSGKPRSYSFNRGADLVKISFYEPLNSYGGLAPRGIISPIAANSIFSYKFRLEGSFVENDELIHKISVIPRRSFDPVYTGTIYIADGSWRVHSADLFITKDQQLQFVDTFRVRQSYVPAAKDVWMPFNNQLSFHFKILGFEGSGDINGVFSKYNISPGLTAKDFSGEILKVNKESNKRDSVYWQTNRPMPLTGAEQSDYIRNDSISIVRESKPYRDSVDRTVNAFTFNSVLSGYTHQNSSLYRKWNIASPLSTIQFNSVEGWRLTLSGEYRQDYGDEDRRYWLLQPFVQYGFSNEHLNPKLTYSYRYDPVRNSRIEISGGSEVLQFNNENPISPSLNSAYSLWARKNYMKIYEQGFFRLFHRTELFNGISLGTTAGYAVRQPLENTTDYAFGRAERVYTPNAPILTDGDTVAVEEHCALTLDIKMTYVIGQQYVSLPSGRYRLGSEWPTLTLQYKKAIRVADDAVDFDFLQLQIYDEVDFGLLGTFQYKAGAGKFLTAKNVQFMDYKHFNGNKTFFSNFGITDFMGLDYYAYSSTLPFFEAHAEHHFKGFLLNKLPLIRKLKLDEVASAHFVTVDGQKPVLEIGAGVEKLNLFRIQVFSSYNDGKFSSPGVVIGIKTPF
jgi:hypothetical protein